jgi:hypothetical protein
MNSKRKGTCNEENWNGPGIAEPGAAERRLRRRRQEGRHNKAPLRPVDHADSARDSDSARDTDSAGDANSTGHAV